MSIGIWQIVLILVIVLILFGAGKLPRVMGDVAKGVKSFKAGLKDDETEEAADDTKEVPHAQARAAEAPEPAESAAEAKVDEPAKT